MLTDIGHIVEERQHQLSVVLVLLGKGLVACCSCRIHLCVQQTAILLIQEVHVAMGGIVMDFQVGAHPGQLHQGILHREVATELHRATGIDGGIVRKHLWEALYHTLHDLLLLLGAQRSQLAVSAVGFLVYKSQSAQHVLSQCGQLAQTVGLSQCPIRLLIVLSTVMIT